MKLSLGIASALGVLVSAMPYGILETRQVVGITANDINGPCKDVMLIFARGTFELGNMGNVIGGALATDLVNGLRGRSVGVQGIDYPADVGGYLLGGDQGGSNKMAQMVNDLARRCPNTKIALSGYSQGGQVTHNAVGRMNAEAKSHIAAIVIFGDPLNGVPFPGISNDRVKTFCDIADLICAHLPLPIVTHLAYGANAGAAAEFIRSKVQ